PLLFPEGTRVAPGAAARFKMGGALLAVRTGAVVVPVALNAGECWRRNAFIKKPGMITVSIGPAIESSGHTPEELNATVQAWIEGEMRELNPERYVQQRSARTPVRRTGRPRAPRARGGAVADHPRPPPRPGCPAPPRRAPEAAPLLTTPAAPPATVATPRPDVLPAGARWREVATEQQTIGFVLLRSRRRSIGFVVADDGLRVTAPNWVTLAQIDD